MNEKAQREIREANRYREIADVLHEIGRDDVADLIVKLAQHCEQKAIILDQLTRIHIARNASKNRRKLP